MRVVVAIDDTDNLESRGTGEIASLIADAIRARGWGSTTMVTRHQLLVHPDIPYTSHNSAMCFLAELNEGCLDPMIRFAGEFLDQECAEGSDPGLCVADLATLKHGSELIDFGRRAKREVITMDEAFRLAGRIGVHLSQHGGTGQGVIGALAGAGLRLWGNDGRMKGSLKFAGAGGTLSVAELLAHPDVDEVRALTEATLRPGDLVRIDDKPKTVMVDGASVLLVSPVEPGDTAVSWQTLHRKQLREY